MGFDWKGLEQRDREKNTRVALGLGLAWVTLGAIGLGISLLVGSSKRLDSLLYWLAIGVLFLVFGLVRSRRKHD